MIMLELMGIYVNANHVSKRNHETHENQYCLLKIRIIKRFEEVKACQNANTSVFSSFSLATLGFAT